MKYFLKLGLLAGMFFSFTAARASTPVLYCQDLPLSDIEVVEVATDESGTEIVSRYRDGRVDVSRLGFRLALHVETRIELPKLGEIRRDLFLGEGGWVLRSFEQENVSIQDVFCD